VVQLNPLSSVVTEPPGRRLRQLPNDYVVPTTPLQRRLANLWSKMLDVEPVGLHDDFFELGGHSLLAAELLDALAHEFGVNVSARVLYLQPTIAELADAIEKLPAAEDEPS
jgi:acyl carrier protein